MAETISAALEQLLAVVKPKYTDPDEIVAVARAIGAARAALARWGRHDPPAAGAPGPSMEDVSPLIAWLTEQACQAADDSQPTDAGMLTWAAQVIGERVDEDAPAPPAAGEAGELAALIHQISLAWEPDACLLGNMTAGQLTRAADLLAQRHPEPVPVSEGVTDEEWYALVDRLWDKYQTVGPQGERSVYEYAFLNACEEIARYGRYPEPAPPAEGEVGELSVVHATAPERIWLYLNGANEYLPFRNEDDVIWSPDPIDSSDIPYVRADLLTQRYLEPVPVAGEARELVDRLRRASDGASAMGWEQDSWLLARAADLLAKRHPKPVPVAERPWERRGWCDDQGRCWFCNSYSMDRWSYSLPPSPGQDWGRLGTITHSLPHWAIPRPRPLPQQETTNG